MSADLLQRGKQIKLAVFDVDGVLTDGRLYFLEDGSEFKTFNTLDGQGIKMLMAAGVPDRHHQWPQDPGGRAASKTSASRTFIRVAKTNWWCSTNFGPV